MAKVRTVRVKSLRLELDTGDTFTILGEGVIDFNSWTTIDGTLRMSFSVAITPEQKQQTVKALGIDNEGRSRRATKGSKGSKPSS